MNSNDLDIERADELLLYLRQTNRIRPDETPRMARLAGGVSNRTVLVQRNCGEAWVLKQALAKLRVAADWFCDPARIRREALGLLWLAKLAPAGSITPLVFEDPERNLLAMQAVPQPHENFKSLLLDGTISGKQTLSLIDSFGELLGQIHRRGFEQRAQIAVSFDDRSFFESLRLEPYYIYAGRQAPDANQFLEALVAETRERRLTIVHGDYSPKNVLVREGRLVLLDHEVIHFGDPAFDIGFAMTHLLSKAHHCRERRALMAEAAQRFFDRYASVLGDVPWKSDLERMAVRHTLACLLARVSGRSPLEYLTESERQAQRQAAVELKKAPPITVSNLINEFLRRV